MVKNHGAAWNYSDSERRQIIAARRIAAIPTSGPLSAINVGDESLVAYSKRPTSSQQEAKNRKEVNEVAILLRAVGSTPATLHPQDSPDVRAEFYTRSVYIEHAQIIAPYSARLTTLLWQISEAVRKRIAQDVSLSTKLAKREYQIRVPPDAASERDNIVPNRDAIVRAILAHVNRSEFSEFPQADFVNFGEDFPELQKWSAKFFTKLVDYVPSPNVWLYAHSFSPSDLARTFLDRVASKVELAKRYNVRPLWLALFMSDFMGDAGLSIDELANTVLEFAPFEKVIVGDERDVLTFDVLAN